MPDSTPVSPKPEQDAPTLMIGLGGTGANVADQIRKLVQQNLHSGENQPPVLLIDEE